MAKWGVNTSMGNNRNHALQKGNKFATHKQIYRQLRKNGGLSAG